MNADQWNSCYSEVASLLKKGAENQVDSLGLISSVILISKKTGDFRHIIDLKGLHKFLVDRNFKMEGVNIVRQTIK